MNKSLLKMPKMVHFDEFLKTWSLRSYSVTRQVTLNRTKIGGKCQSSKIRMRHFWVIFKQCAFTVLQDIVLEREFHGFFDGAGTLFLWLEIEVSCKRSRVLAMKEDPFGINIWQARSLFLQRPFDKWTTVSVLLFITFTNCPGIIRQWFPYHSLP